MNDNGRVLASAAVDRIGGGSVPIWEVTVWGEAPFDHTRIYILELKTDNFAAQEGIRLFVEEMDCLRDVINEED
jgi:hypothetical protein